jgi:hypothetical protein
MQDQPEIIFQTDADPLAHPANLSDSLTFHASHRWIRSTKQKRTGDPYVFQGLPEDAFLERFNVDDDIG